MTDQPKELPITTGFIAWSPDYKSTRSIDSGRIAIVDLREPPAPGRIVGQTDKARAESLEAALRSVLAKVNDLPPSHVSHYQDDIADINDLTKQALGESGVGE